MKKLKDLLEGYIENKNIISIERQKIDPHKIIATPLKMSQHLLLFAYWYDFFPNGFKIIKMDDITSIRHDDSEIFIEEINRNEKIKIDSKRIDSISIINFQQVLKMLAELNVIVTVEHEGYQDSDFYIGEILSIKPESAEILEFDSAGKWYEKSSTVKYEDITCVTFNDNYSLLMGKYAKLGKEK